MRIAAVLVAAGRGRRFGDDLPKQYQLLRGEPVLRRTAARFLEGDDVALVQPVIGPDDGPLYDLAMRTVADGRLLAPVPGGATRQESVLCGLEALSTEAPDIVLIHDGARPLITAEAIKRAIAAADESGGAIVAVPVADTLKRVANDVVTDTIDRAGLWRAQTPQAFRFAEILQAHRDAAASGVTDLTDDAAVFERAGGVVQIALGGEDNIKITEKSDLQRAESILAGREDRSQPSREDFVTGTGFDVHAFEPGDHVWLCGVKVPHEFGLKGHSDADAGLHALTDALLGAISAGDIGAHFPPSDPRWSGADSQVFLRHAADLVTSAGGRIVHADVTIICERPKVGPHKDAMIARIAEILDLPARRVSVKATTTEGLGFTGRREGIAAQASATVAIAG